MMGPVMIMCWKLLIVVLLILFYNDGYMACPVHCSCKGKLVDCSSSSWNITDLNHISVDVEVLILDNNTLTDDKLPGLNRLSNLKELSLSHNLLTYLDESVFSNLLHLQKLNVSHNKIKSLQSRLFSSKNVIQILDLSYNELDSITALEGSFQELQQLYLHHNKLTRIDAVDTNRLLPKLEILKASHNEIATLKNDMQLNLFAKLHTLELDNNKIPNVGYYFMKFSGLKKIVLSHNEIRIVQQLSFVKNEQLEELYLDNNKLDKLIKLWLKSLKKINLSSNNIDGFEHDAFKDYYKIQYIDLSNNQLHSIKQGMLQNLQNLTDLNLHNNQISSVSRRAFESLVSLVNLNLSQNNIALGVKEFDLAFKPLTSLRRLDLSHNKILLLPSLAFGGLAKLSTLLLEGNDIKYIRKDAFVNLKNLVSLRLETSSLDCDCSIIWFREWLSSSSTLKNQSISGKCASPAWLKNKLVMSILKREMTCVRHGNGHTIRPNITHNPVSRMTPIHGNVTLKCEATSSVDKPLLITWYRDSTLFKNKKAVTVSEQQLVSGNLYKRSSVLKLEHIQYKDKGRYWCDVANTYGSDRSTYANVSVVSLPIITKTVPAVIRLRAGEEAHIPCSAEGIPAPMITFSKEIGDKTAWKKAAEDRRIHYQKETFIIQSLKVEDSGLYACTAKSIAGMTNATVRLVVAGKPTFIRSMKSKRVPVGTVAVLDCIISGNPRPEISWYKDNVQLDHTSSVRLSDQMLIISDFRETDVGLYSCHAVNALGSARQSARLKISYPEPEQQDLNTAILVMTGIVVFTVTSFIWFLLLCVHRRRKKRASIADKRAYFNGLAMRPTPANATTTNNASIPGLPANFLLRCNGELISPQPQQQVCNESQADVEGGGVLIECSEPPIPTPLTAKDKKRKYPAFAGRRKHSVTVDVSFEEPDQETTHLLLDNALNYLREQQGDVRPACTQYASTEEEDEDDQHDSGILVHYKSGSSLADHHYSHAEVVSRGLPFVTIDLKNSTSTSTTKRDVHRDRRKDSSKHTNSSSRYTKHKHSSSIDSSTLCMNNNSSAAATGGGGGDKKRRRRLGSASSGIESGLSSCSSLAPDLEVA